MKYACITIVLLLIAGSAFSECRNAEHCGTPNNCVRCTEDSEGKSGGAITSMSKFSSPKKIYPTSNQHSCIPCSCGDGNHEAEEECDDGNEVNGDGCNIICQIEICGDGIINLAAEECDDANSINNDECSNNCKQAKCGDSILHATEECDDGNTINNDECSNNCKQAKCGDLILHANEECDDGNLLNNDGCTNSCVKEFCGDEIKQDNEECDDGNTLGGDLCSASCRLMDQSCRYHRMNMKGNLLQWALWDGKKMFEGDLSKLSCIEQIWGNPPSASGNLSDDYAYAQFLYSMGFGQSSASLIGGIGTIYLDSDCKRVLSDVSESEVCGDIEVQAYRSPISLLVKQNFDLNKTWKIAKFMLDPQLTSDQWVIWKGSAEAPLLVYDPEHSGVITNGSQLFGNFTFGGKSSELRKISSNTFSKQEVWRDGFEALAVMDANSDGKVSGIELKDLALWFDYNQNAISEAGEVKALSATDISELKYNSEYKDNRGDIYITSGFVTSSDFVGTSVDWYSPIYNTQQAAVASLANRIKPKKIETNPETSSKSKGNFSGVYLWSSDDSNVASGLLVIRDVDNKISGYSLTEAKFAGKKKQFNRLLAYPISGEKIIKDNKPTLKFKVMTSKNKYTETFAHMEGEILMGASSMQIFEAGKETKVDYTWKAKLRSQSVKE